jgi:hypothetical protein
MGCIDVDPWFAIELPLPDGLDRDGLRRARDTVYAIIHTLSGTLDDSLPFVGRLAELPLPRGLAAPASAALFNRLTPGCWGQRRPISCAEDGQVTIVAYRVLESGKMASNTALPMLQLAACSPNVPRKYLINIFRIVAVRMFWKMPKLRISAASHYM